jgi:hypothetical protein
VAGLTLSELRVKVKEKNAQLPKGKKFNPYGKSRAQIEQFLGISSTQTAQGFKPKPAVKFQTAKTSSLIADRLAKRFGGDAKEIHKQLKSDIQAALNQKRKELKQQGIKPTEKALRQAAIEAVKQSAKQIGGDKLAPEAKAKRTQPALTSEQHQRINAILDQLEKLKQQEASPTPEQQRRVKIAPAQIDKVKQAESKPKTSQDYIEDAKSIFPPELDRALQLRRKNVDKIVQTHQQLEQILSHAAKLRQSGQQLSADLAERGRALRDRRKAQQEYDQALIRSMAKFRDSLLESSPEQRKAATRFANSIEIDAAAANGKSAKELRRDAMEYHLITGGGGESTLKSFTRDDDRAYANIKRQAVNIGANPTRDIMFHEMAHHLEAEDPNVGKAALDWIKRRATGKLQKLSELTGNSGYKDNEIAVPDHFLKPYVGKVYLNPKTGKPMPTTEVVSMGVERFASPEKMVEFYLQDPEHFMFTLGIMRKRKKS